MRIPKGALRRRLLHAFRSVLLIVLVTSWCFLLGKNAAHAQQAGEPTPPVDPTTYLLQLGPIGALVWGAYWIGKGVKFTIVVELSESDREMISNLRPKAA